MQTQGQEKLESTILLHFIIFTFLKLHKTSHIRVFTILWK